MGKLTMKGYTIIEMIIVVAILGIMAAVFTTIFSEGNHAFFFLSQQNQTLEEARVAMKWMAQELTTELLVGGYHSFDATNRPDTGYLKFTRNTMLAGETSSVITYSWSANTLTRQFFGGTVRTLASASSGSSFTFTYLDATRTALVTPVTTANLSKIVSIVITMTLQVGSDAITLKSEIAPRNADIPAQICGGSLPPC